MVCELSKREDFEVATGTDWALQFLPGRKETNPHLDGRTLSTLMNPQAIFEGINNSDWTHTELHRVGEAKELVKETYRRIVEVAITHFGVEILPVVTQIEGQNG